MTGRSEIVSVASGKGGTGKTIILASLGYALQKSGNRVLFIDSDSATDGLSLFILGPRGWEGRSDFKPQNTLLDFLTTYEQGPQSGRLVVPFKANRGRQDDHGQFYNIVLSRRGLYGDVNDDALHSAAPQSTRESFRNGLRELFKWLRGTDQWNYILVDTRGGFDFQTTDVCALSDSFFVVTEPDHTSFNQDKSLIFRITAAAKDLSCKPLLRGIIVNKATEYPATDKDSELGIHRVDLDPVEPSFRTLLVEQFGIRYEDTHPIPLDIKAVGAYRSQKIPYVICPGSVFSYATLVAFSKLMKTATVRWPQEITARWNELVDLVSAAIRAENDRTIKEQAQSRALQTTNERLEQQNRFLEAQIEELKDSLKRRGEYEREKGEYDKVRLERDKELFQRQSRQGVLVPLMMGLAMFVSLGMLFYVWIRANEQQTALREVIAQQNEQQTALREVIARQDVALRDLQKQIEQLRVPRSPTDR